MAGEGVTIGPVRIGQTPGIIKASEIGKVDDMSPGTRRGPFERLATFRRCAGCDYDFVTGEGTRSCHYGACPYLPEELDPRCPICQYNFVTDDLEPACGDPPTCDFARIEAPQRIEAVRALRW